MFFMSKKFSFLIFLYFLITGFFFSFLIPPFQKPDEFAHFKKTVSVANFDFFCQNKKQPINANLYHIINSAQIRIQFDYYNKIPVSFYKDMPLKNELKMLDLTEGCRFKDFAGYLLPAFFYQLISWLPLNGFLLFGLIRFSIFLFCYSILIFLTLKNKDKFFQLLSFFILLLPMTINQFSAFSYDASHLFFGLIFLNLFFNHFYLKQISFQYLLSLVLSFLFFAFSKPLYDLFFLLFFLIDKRYFEKLKIKKEVLLIFVFIVLAFLRIPSYRQTGLSLGNFDSRIQKMIFLENPWRFFSLLEKTYFDFFDDYVKSFIGVLGWLDFELDFFVYLFFLVFFGFIIGSFFKKINISKSQAFIYFLVSFGTFFLILMAEFFYWTAPGASHIAGVQGRYLIILLPIFSYFLIFFIKRFSLIFFGFILLFLIFLNTRAIFYRYFDYSVYARPTKDLKTIKGDFILIKPKEEKILVINDNFNGACYGVYLKFKNKKFNAPVRVEVFDKKVKRVVYFLENHVTNLKEPVSTPFPKTKFQSPVYIKIINRYANTPLRVFNQAALSCITDFWFQNEK